MKKKVYGGDGYLNSDVRGNDYTPRQVSGFFLRKGFSVNFRKQCYNVYRNEAVYTGKGGSTGLCNCYEWQYKGDVSQRCDQAFPFKSVDVSNEGCWYCEGGCSGEGNCKDDSDSIIRKSSNYYYGMSFNPVCDVALWGAQPNVVYQYKQRIHVHEFYIKESSVPGVYYRDSRIIGYVDFEFEFTIPEKDFVPTQRVVDKQGYIYYYPAHVVTFEFDADELTGDFHSEGEARLCVKGACSDFSEFVYDDEDE